jgi:hypothetical protein
VGERDFARPRAQSAARGGCGIRIRAGCGDHRKGR